MGNKVGVDDLSEKNKMRIQASLTDYVAMRTEQNVMLTRQTTVLCLTITIAGVLFGLGYSLIPQNISVVAEKASAISENSTMITENMSKLAEDVSVLQENTYGLLRFGLFSVIIPCVCMFTGAIWLDCAYRQQRLCAYMYRVEDRVNRMLEVKESCDTSCLFWEHFAAEDSKTKKIFKTNMLYYFFCLALYIFFPVLCFVFDRFVMKTKMENWGYIIIGIYALYLVFCLMYIGRIMKTHPYLEKKGNKKGRQSSSKTSR